MSRRRVLIADDSAVVRITIARRVRAAGFDVVEYDSVASALEADASTVDCALLDFDLGDGYGTAIASRLRAAQRSLPIAFFTSTTGNEVVEAQAFGPIFEKPDQIDAALDWVARACTI